MKAFVCVGLALIGALVVISFWASNCLTCCGGEPCSSALRQEQIAGGK